MHLSLGHLEKGHVGTLRGGNLPGPGQEPQPPHGHAPRGQLGPLVPTLALTGFPDCPPSILAGGVPTEPHGCQTDIPLLCVNEPPVWTVWKLILEILPSAEGKSSRGINPVPLKSMAQQRP